MEPGRSRDRDASAFVTRLAEPRALLLDGATGTEIERRGLPSELPLWSSHALVHAPEVVAEIHADYVAAGAELITANTFRTQARSLASAGLESRAPELTARAVALARRAAQPRGSTVFVAGSVSPLEDCYFPDRVPPDTTLEREHAEHVAHLVEAGVDVLLVETMNCVREARAAVRAAIVSGIPALASFVCGAEARLLSGELLRDGVAAVASLGAHAVLVNCLAPSAVPACLPVLATSGLPFGVYANLGCPNPAARAAPVEDCAPAEYAAHAERWIAAGARIVGGCCGTTPAHVQAIAARMRIAG